ncbi:dethiobiotin synthase [Shewanella sp. GD03713]|uniref:dethiobiotin synthase n=1 Tax=Shewanella sp. GD03713 TaxID=2975372 RepID=UPI000B344217|nr:dethiobiotin synthase [Shewanella sp. GD03713]MDH1470813.1 dethiobiotin synthase [Shewanella sp. GD03713]QXN26534.1 dethiobiotin synthase [Shewanella putrefaciens]VEE60431.1 ATP-dependent dethiobiotin synthetase BioD 1 [Shewanella putrefaciens]
MFFVTGTDTDSGKTLVSTALLTAFNREAARTGAAYLSLGVKPVASGCETTELGLRNSDALKLMSASSLKLSYEKVNPVSFEPAIAPHIAAKQQGINISPEAILAKLDRQAFEQADFCLIEGAGGWRLPLGDGRYLSELVQQLNLEVILVVGMKLGCLNHALLTQEAIIADGLTVAGWVANCVDPNMSVFDENLASLKEMMTAPFLGCIPHLTQADAEHAANFIDIQPLLLK